MTRHRPGLTVRVLGPPSVLWNGRPLEVAGRKQVALIYALAIRHEGMAKDELTELLWGHRRRASLRTALYRLRRHARATDWLVDDHASGRLRIIGASDIAASEQRGAAGDVAGALELLPSGPATQDVRTSLLFGFTLDEAPAFGDWIGGERERLSGYWIGVFIETASAALHPDRPTAHLGPAIPRTPPQRTRPALGTPSGGSLHAHRLPPAQPRPGHAPSRLRQLGQ